jgi:RNA polymerase sigma-70 factor, ECF subfamily
MGDFERSIEAEMPALRRYARALLRDSERAEDLVQDCLVRALSRRHLFIRPGNLRGWLLRIMHNIHANAVRSEIRHPTAPWLAEAVLSGIPADQISRVELAETLAAFDRLSEEHREVLLLVLVEGLSYREVARVLGFPAGTIMSRMARAREQLRVLMSNTPATHLRRVK